VKSTLISAWISMILAYMLLIPGVQEPILHIVTTLDKNEMLNLGKETIIQNLQLPQFVMPMIQQTLDQIHLNGQMVIHDTQKSILQTSETLWQDGNPIVAAMIITFSIVVPLLKLLLIVSAHLSKRYRDKLHTLSSNLSKWSMADVFVIAILISFLAIKASSGDSNLVTTEVALKQGFYLFLGYCLMSIIAGQFFVKALAESKIIEAENRRNTH
jgi:hypothetical protein